MPFSRRLNRPARVRPVGRAPCESRPCWPLNLPRSPSRATTRWPISRCSARHRATAQFEYYWDEHRWQFANAQHRDLFKADPGALRAAVREFLRGGAVARRSARGQPEYWLISDGKLYLFGKAFGPALFRKDLDDPRARQPQPRDCCRRRPSAPRRVAAPPCAGPRAGARDRSDSGTCCRRSAASNVGSVRRIVSATRAASAARPACA